MHSPEFKQIVDEAKAQIQEIRPADLKRMQDSEEDFTLIDVREADEQAEGHNRGSGEVAARNPGTRHR